jgi:ERCC4-type nuclease
MNKSKNIVLERGINRKQYELVKKMDRQQFNNFCKNLYDQGRESVKRKSLTSKEIKEVLLSVKGIGEKRAEEIVKKLEAKVNEEKQEGGPDEEKEEKNKGDITGNSMGEDGRV